jgi:biotin synthase-related radical SAM superfamily protein
MVDRINVSAGTAGVLGLLTLTQETPPTTAYLMLGGRCSMNCGFCAQARQSQAPALNLSRVTWPAFSLPLVVERLAAAFAAGSLRRACLQMTVTRRAGAQALEVVRAVRAACAIPFDVAILPESLDEVRELLEAGVEHIGFGLDAASRRVFEATKSGNWERSLALIRQTAETFAGRAAVHLIVGLGETEQEMAAMIDQMHGWGVTVGLFAFTPVRGTALEGRPAPALGQYRRMQAVRFLISRGYARLSDLRFDAGGRLARIDVPGWPALLAGGQAFETSGCPDCNRPYYNERPGGTMYNYPRRLLAEEAGRALAEMEME